MTDGLDMGDDSSERGRRGGGVVVIGGGGHATVLIAVLHKLAWDVIGYTDLADRGSIFGAPWLGDDGALTEVAITHAGCSVALGVGKVDASSLRRGLLARAVSEGFAAPVVASPDAVVNADAKFGDGTVVFDGAVVNSRTSTGRACIINTNSTVEHDCLLGDNVHVASGATVCGGVSIGRDCLIGAGATVVQGVRICDGCLVGAGSVVTRDLTSPGTYFGTPAERAG
jgi:sugar O-acyltransferase (sialic acid O-acetyltransferase NeuD family)